MSYTHIRRKRLCKFSEVCQASSNVYAPTRLLALVQQNAQYRLGCTGILYCLIRKEYILTCFEIIASVDFLIRF